MHPADRLRHDEKHSANICFVKLGESLIKPPRSLFMFKYCHGPIDLQAEQFMQSLENIRFCNSDFSNASPCPNFKQRIALES